MYIKSIAISALASTAMAQTSGGLVQALQGQASLSNLTSFLGQFPDLVNQLSGLSNITLLAPNNEAFTALQNSPGFAQLASMPQMIQGILRYHVLNGSYPSISNTSFIPTALMPPRYTNVTGGQRVEAMASNNSVMFYSGMLMNSSVVSTAPINFTGGTVHIINSLLTLPERISMTASALNLTSAAGALNTSGLLNNFDTTKDLTVFVPNNDAFQAIGSALPNLTMEQVQSILKYHCIEGAVAYSTTLMNDTMYTTTQGGNVTVRMIDGNVYVNSARVILPDVLVANGVVHVIDSVLNPMNTTLTPNPSTTAPAFGGASSATNVPYTSGQATPSTTINTSGRAGATGSSSSSSGGAWKPAPTGAMGAAALFGGAAVMLNM